MNSNIIPAEEKESSGLCFLAPEDVRFFRAGATLRLTVGNERSYVKVSVVCAFPLAWPGRYLSIRDAAQKEIGLIADPSLLDIENRRLVAEELERRYIIPCLTRVFSARERFGFVEWEVETNKGRRSFTTRNLKDNMVKPSATRCIITDAEGSRYEISDIGSLDLRSQSLLLHHL